jgi:hypothetical protein
MVAFFLCGTPSNHEGFQFVELGPAKLPGSPGSYLDQAPAEAIESHRFELVSIDGQRFVEYSRTLRINPNDSVANRGAYVAAGCLIEQRLPLHTVANCVDIVSEIYGGVRSALSAERSFPAGYHLRDYEYRGAPLAERLAHQSSPLLLADVLLQALNNEGVFAEGGAKQLTLAPEEVLAADLGRYQLYSAQGALQSLRSLDRDRSQLLELTKHAASASATIDELHNEWSSLQQTIGNGAARVLERSEALRRLAGAMERAVEEHLSLTPHARSGYRADGLAEPSATRGSAPADAGIRIKGRAALPSRDLRSAAGHARRRVRRDEASLPRWATMLGYGLVGVAIAVLLFVSVRDHLPAGQNVLVESVPVVAPEDSLDGEQQQAVQQQQNDVASQRAALDASPEQ